MIGAKTAPEIYFAFRGRLMSHLQANTMLVMKALPQDVAVLAFAH
ncbi:hypothetical protein [Oceanobacillus senegalensis]|nr:hypothetical protein [Oceanobacillus senegalensis]